ncbi:ribonuclease H-like domain-containing protein [Tanacetum coccineum]
MVAVVIRKRLYARALGWLLEEIHVTWAHLEKKQKKLRLYTKSFEEIVNIVRGDGVINPKRRRQDFQDDGVRDFAMASECSRLKKALEESMCFALRNFDLEDMEFESTNSNTTAKLPILKLENGNSWVSVPQTAQENGTSVMKMSVPTIAEEKTNKKNDVKARSLLLMALPNEHQLTFSQYPDAKTMFATIETRFRGNEATKKMQKTLLKQSGMFRGARAFYTFDVGYRVLRGFPLHRSSINNSASLSNKFGECYFTFKFGISGLLHQVITAIADRIRDLEQLHEDDLEVIDLKWQLSLLSLRAKRYFQRTGKKIFINANDTARYDKSKVECFNYHKMGHFARECRAPRNKEGQFKYQDNTRKQGNNEDTSSKAMLAIDGIGFDWSDMAEEKVQTNMALMAFSDSEVYNDKTYSKTCLKNFETLKKQSDDLIVKLKQTEFTATTYKRGLATVEEQLITYRKNEVCWVLEFPAT